MSNPGLLLTFAAAVALLALVPGPNVALIVANSVAHGTNQGLLTVAGTGSAMAAQLAFMFFGLTKMLDALGVWFDGLRWIGVAYLVVLGISYWRSGARDLTGVRADARSPCSIYGRAVLVSLTNPKTLLFYGAFFPQFVTPGPDAGRQIAVLAAIFLVVAVSIDSAWVLLASRARFLLASSGRVRNRVSGGLLVGAGAALAFARTK